MKKVISVSISVALMLITSGCSKESNSNANGTQTPSVPQLSGEVVKIESSQGAINASSVLLASANFLPSSTTNRPSRAPARASQLVDTITCADSGSIKFYADSDTFITKSVYESCVEDGTTLTGVTKHSGDEYHYTDAFENFKADFEDGYMRYNLKSGVNTNANYDPFSVTSNGTMDINTTQYKPIDMHLEFVNFKTVMYGHSGGSVEGSYSVVSQNMPCANGIYNIKTLEPLQSNGYGRYVDGKIEVNGVVYEFNDEGSMRVIFEDGTAQTVSQEANGSCS